ncbi:hypothetical protein CVD25_12040 [Bacillus canaveralius]|uniref:Metallo-beta-lactamase domain-containing protein n=1 Tax=Bacillus canaveralius TaxID=1403243 RepID=A0A2N5GNF2_9BACI|nr:MBL fold metallo-hydrolase [Bacillus canaveralius]PLR83762.1 hypothetical protein CU635_08460 [Bacillus canaveralius]PLR96448.1 hypothetical protein CVD25_12040 [Bacillus canaveralius]
MKLTVIGCWGGYPKINEASTGYLLEENGFKLLIDCGSGVLSKLQNIIQPEEINSVILSHYHADHIADIGVLQHARLIQSFLGKKMDELPIYAPESEQEFPKLTHKNITNGVEYHPAEVLTVGPFSIRFLRTDHPVPCYAMRIETGGKVFVYTADTSYKHELEQFSKDADLLLCECNFYKEQDGKNAGHMNSLDAGKLAAVANVKRLILTHLPHYGDIQRLKEEAAEVFNGPILVASENLSITL